MACCNLKQFSSGVPIRLYCISLAPMFFLFTKIYPQLFFYRKIDVPTWSTTCLRVYASRLQGLP